MIGGDEMQLDMEQLFPNISSKSGISVKDNRMRHDMSLEYIIHENLSHIGGGKYVLKRIEMSRFGKTINNHHDD